jgi:EmrB/QacA subfamily drug resistance transporter
MVFLDETVVNVALPSIKGDLGFSQASLAWVVSAYMLTFGGLLLLGGRVADLFGRRRLFLVGIALFGLASLADGVAHTQGLLIAARGAQGVGAALATPAALALVTALFPSGPERMKALGIWGALSGLGFAIGILLGGAITEAASWRWVFLINVPLVGVVLPLVPRLVAESRSAGGRRLGIPGGVAVTVATAALAYALLDAPVAGWRSPRISMAFALAAALLAAFVLIEQRSAAPLLPARLVRRREMLVPNVLQLLFVAAMPSTLFLLTLYLQQVLGYSPLDAGLAYLPLAGSVAAATAVANRLLTRFGPRPPVVAGLALAAAGVGALGRVPVGGSYWADVLPALVAVGAGAGVAFVSITTAALAWVEDDDAGVASGLLSTSALIGGALGIAVLVAVAGSRRTSLLASGSSALEAKVGGLQAGFLVAAGLALAAAAIAFLAPADAVPAEAATEPS